MAWEEKFRSKEATNNITNLHFLFSLGTTNEKKKTKMMSREVVKQLIALRTSKNKTQKQLANELNLMPKIIQEIETYRHHNDMKLAQRIAHHLGGTLKK